MGSVNISRVLGVFCKQHILKNVKRCSRAHCLTLGTLKDSSYHSHTIFWTTCRTPESFLSFGTALSHQYLLRICIQNLCVVRCSIDSSWLLTHAAKKRKEKAWRALLCKCMKRVRQREQVKCRFAEKQEQNVSVQTPLRCSDLNMCTTAPTWKQLNQNIVFFFRIIKGRYQNICVCM